MFSLILSIGGGVTHSEAEFNCRIWTCVEIFYKKEDINLVTIINEYTGEWRPRMHLPVSAASQGTGQSAPPYLRLLCSMSALCFVSQMLSSKVSFRCKFRQKRYGRLRFADSSRKVSH